MSRKPFTILALHGSWGGAYNLNRAINQFSQKHMSALVTSRPSTYHFGDGVDVVKDAEEVSALLEPSERLWVCDCGGLLTLARYVAQMVGWAVSWEPWLDTSKPMYDWLSGRSMVFFWSGSPYLRDHERMNALADALPCKRRYAMCDLLRCDPKAMPLMQTYEGVEPVAERYDEFTVGHSPGEKYEADLKGSSIIESAAQAVGARMLIIKGMRHADALMAKGKCHVFVDQIAPTVGGIGKSGLEAMLMGVPTLCDIRHSRYDGYYAGMPVPHVSDKGSLVDALGKLLHDDSQRAALGAACLAWAQRLRFRQTAAYLDETLEWA